MSFASDFANLRDAVVANLRTNIPGVPSIEPHGGAFTQADIAQFMTQTPALRVALMGCGACYRNNYGVILPTHFSVVVVTKDIVDPATGKKNPRDHQAALIANAVLLNVMSNRFGLDGVYQPEELKSVNQYSVDFFERGLALWEVTWTTPVTLGLLPDITATIAALAKIYVNGVLFTDPNPVIPSDPLRDTPTEPGWTP